MVFSNIWTEDRTDVALQLRDQVVLRDDIAFILRRKDVWVAHRCQKVIKLVLCQHVFHLKKDEWNVESEIVFHSLRKKY
jgi:hypothetical protein